MMMSVQPQQPSEADNPSGNPSSAIELARQIYQMPNIESQIPAMIRILEQTFLCDARIWISDYLSPYVSNAFFSIPGLRIPDYSNLITQAILNKSIVSDLKTQTNESLYPLIVATPLLGKKDVLGVIQLTREKEPGFSPDDLLNITEYSFNFSRILDSQIQELRCSDNQQNHELWMLSREIIKSISSNLDIENLINSTASLLCKQFGYTGVTIYTTRDETIKLFSRFGMKDEEIEGPELVIIDQEESLISKSILQHKVLTRSSDEAAEDIQAPGSEEKLEIAIPIELAGDVLGVMHIWRNIQPIFDFSEASILQSISDHLAIAIRNANLFRLEKNKRKIAEDFLDEFSSMSIASSVDDIFNQILPNLSKYLSYDFGAFWLSENNNSNISEIESNGEFRLVDVYLSRQFIESNPQWISLEHAREKLLEHEIDFDFINRLSWLLEVIERGEPVISRDNKPIEPFGNLLPSNQDHSQLAIPLFSNKQLVGILQLISIDPYGLNNEILPIAQTLADYTALLIKNVLILYSAHDQTWMASLILQSINSYQSVTSIEDLNETIARSVLDVVAANACIIYYWDGSLNSFYPQYSTGYDEEQRNLILDLDVIYGSTVAFDQLFDAKSPVIIDTGNLDDHLFRNIFPRYDLSEDLLILFPLLLQENIIGAILVDFSGSKLSRNSRQKIWDDIYSSVQAATQQAAAAINNLQQTQAKEEEAYISIALLQVAQAVVSLSRLDEVLSLIVRITPLLVGVKRCIIYLWDEGEQVFHPSNYYGLSKTEVKFEGQPIRSGEFPFIAKVLESNQIVYFRLPNEWSPSNWNEINISDLFLIEGFPEDPDERFTFTLDEQTIREKSRLLIGFPLSVKGEVFGVMLIEEEDPIKGSPFYHIREKRIEIVRGITQQAALAIQNNFLIQEAVNSERMERELQLAREIQQTFLPQQLPNLSGWEIAARWKPARQVAGDFYDFIRLNNDQIGFVIADVADKGMPAALFMILIRTLLRAAAKGNLSPAAVLKEVNELLIQDSKNGMFVTVFYALIDISNGEIVYANAGHNPPMLKRANYNTLNELTRTGMALGVFPDIDIDEHRVSLSSGDWIFFYTDGITEAFSNRGEMFGIERLSQILLRFEDNSPENLLNQIDQSIVEFLNGEDLSDDITMAALIRK